MAKKASEKGRFSPVLNFGFYVALHPISTAIYPMNLRNTRHIIIKTTKGSFLVPTHSYIEQTGNVVKVKFTFDKNLSSPEFEYVIADNEDGYIRMVTSKGIGFNSGSLFDQLFVWFDFIIKN